MTPAKPRAHVAISIMGTVEIDDPVCTFPVQGEPRILTQVLISCSDGPDAEEQRKHELMALQACTVRLLTMLQQELRAIEVQAPPSTQAPGSA